MPSSRWTALSLCFACVIAFAQTTAKPDEQRTDRPLKRCDRLKGEEVEACLREMRAEIARKVDTPASVDAAKGSGGDHKAPGK